MAASITTWNRLEPVDHSSDLGPALAAVIADPLWLLHRQWQLGELDGNDAGSPIAVSVEHLQVPLSRYRPGDPTASGGRAVDYDPATMPLEPLVEAERVRGIAGQHRRLAAETGQHFVRLLAPAGLSGLAAEFRLRFPLRAAPVADPVADPIGTEAATLLDARAVDGDALAAELRPLQDATGTVGELPASFPRGANPGAVLAVANTWLRWYDALLIEPAAAAATKVTPSAWDTRRLEYQFAAAARHDGVATTFGATAYDDGHLDWADFSAGPTPNLGRPTVATTPAPIVDVTIPVPLTYAGMPAHRHWEIEDSRVSFAGIEAGSTDIVRMLLTEFALVYGEDWFVVPLPLAVGTLGRIRSMTVRDTFGVVSGVSPSAAATAGSRRWAMFELAPSPGTAAGSAGVPGPDTMFVPPTLGATMDGPALEEVAFFRDEMANVVWAVERTTASPLGTPIDRYRHGQPVERVAVDVTDVGDAELVYRLATPMPTNWYPYLSRRTESGDDITLERLARSRPQGAIVRESASLEDEEVSRGGVVVQRAWQFARWTDGRPLLWLGRRVHGGRGEGSSGLAWDTTELPN